MIDAVNEISKPNNKFKRPSIEPKMVKDKHHKKTNVKSRKGSPNEKVITTCSTLSTSRA